MTTKKQVAAKFHDTVDGIARKREGITRYGTVSNVQGAFVNVRLEGGDSITNVTNGLPLAAGTRVQVRGRGAQGATQWEVERVAEITSDQRNGDPREIVNTPAIARVATGFHGTPPDNIPRFYLRLAIWQISEQYREGKAVKYEVQLQKSEGADLPVTLVADEHRQMGGALRGDVSDSETSEFQIDPIYGDYPPEFHFDPYGAADVLGEIVYHDSLSANGIADLARAQNQPPPSGTPTSAVSHNNGDFVLARTRMVETIELLANTEYRYRVRAIIGDKTSNFSDWDTITTAYDNVVPSWSSTPTPTITYANRQIIIAWTAANVNATHLLDYEVQVSVDNTFATGVTSVYSRSTQYTLTLRTGLQRFVRVRPRNTSYQVSVSGWSNTARVNGIRDVPDGRPLTNKVSNGDFPSNTTGWTASTALTKNHDSSRGFKALGCCQLEFVRNGGHGGQVNLSQSISGFSAGQYFHAVAYMCRESSFNQTLDEVYLAVTAGSDTYASPLIPYGDIPIKDTGEWLLLECTGQVPAATTSVTFRVYANIATSPAVTTFLYLDDCQIYITGSKS